MSLLGKVVVFDYWRYEDSNLTHGDEYFVIWQQDDEVIVLDNSGKAVKVDSDWFTEKKVDPVA
jgi:hypothetical protein